MVPLHERGCDAFVCVITSQGIASINPERLDMSVLATRVWFCSLTEAVFVAEDHLWLSPSNRLLADDPCRSLYVYDGAGRSIILPPDLDPTNQLPLIAVGNDTTLHLKNVNIYNSQCLPACLCLAPGAQMIAREEDDVMHLNFAPIDMQDPMAALERVAGQVPGVLSGSPSRPPQSSEHLQV